MGVSERQAGQSIKEWLARERSAERATLTAQALLETFPGTSQGRALPSSPISREGGPAIPAVTIRRGGPAGEYLHMRGTSVSLASGGADLASETVIRRNGFADTTSPGAEWTYPRTATFKHDIEFEWASYQGGGTVELLVNGTVVRTARDTGDGVGQSFDWYPTFDVKKGDTGKFRITQSSGSAQVGSWDVTVSVQEPIAVKAADVCPVMGSPVTVVDNTQHNGFPAYAIAADGTHVVFYRAATDHTSTDGDAVYRTSSDGISWSSATTLIANDATYTYGVSGLTRLDNDDLMLVVNRQNKSTSARDGLVYTSTDNGANWTQVGTASHTFTDSGFINGPVLELANGDLLLTTYGQDTGDTNRSARVLKSTDSGATWSALATIADGPTDGVDYNEAGLFLFNSEVVALIRHDQSDSLGDDYYRAVSADSGATWSTPGVVLPSAGGAPRPLVRADGTVVVAFRDKDGSSPDYPTRLAVSADGANWTRCAALPPLTGRISTYAQQAEDSDGRLFVAYGEENSLQDDSDINVAAEGA